MSLEFFRKRAYEKGYLKHTEMKPELMYKKMVDSIKDIQATEGFKEIVEYWRRAKSMHSDEFTASDPLKNPNHTALVLERYKMADSFLKFLENLIEA